MWCLLQLIIGVMFVAAHNCHDVVVVVADHWRVFLQLIIGLLFIAADCWRIVYCS